MGKGFNICSFAVSPTTQVNHTVIDVRRFVGKGRKPKVTDHIRHHEEDGIIFIWVSVNSRHCSHAPICYMVTIGWTIQFTDWSDVFATVGMSITICTNAFVVLVIKNRSRHHIIALQELIANLIRCETRPEI